MKRTIYIRLILLTAIAILVCGGISSVIFAIKTQKQIESWLPGLTFSAAKIWENNQKQDASLLSESLGGLRVTIISKNGKVLSDSITNYRNMKTHFNREEFRNAKNGKVYLSVHKSLTLNKSFMYSSTRAKDGTVLRLAYSYQGFLKTVIGELPAIFIAMLIAMILSIFIARKFSRSLTSPLDKQKQDFFSNASHELKTPVTSILGFSEMLENNLIKTNDAKKEAVSRINKEAKRMSMLIDDILMISNLESKSEAIEKGTFNFADVIKDVTDGVSHTKDENKINIKLNLENVFVNADERQLFDLASNLIKNAIKYNKPNGSVFVTLKKQGINVILVVEDTGIGIAKKYQSRVFERFYRVKLNNEERVPGTGLGLSIVKHIVSLYEGEISLQSEENKGTSIKIKLPIVLR